MGRVSKYGHVECRFSYFLAWIQYFIGFLCEFYGVGLGCFSHFLQLIFRKIRQLGSFNKLFTQGSMCQTCCKQ